MLNIKEKALPFPSKSQTKPAYKEEKTKKRIASPGFKKRPIVKTVLTSPNPRPSPLVIK